MSNATSERPARSLEFVHAELLAAVQQIITGDDWQRMLQMASRFHNYSPANCILILAQRPNATRVAGYKTWQSLGRQVAKGERPIRIMAPSTRRREQTDQDGDDTPRVVVVGWRMVSVFDISQTTGEDLSDVGPELLTESAPAPLWDSLAGQVAAAGFTLERGDCGPANGWTDHKTKRVRVRDDVSDGQACKTLAHELAHVLLHVDSEHYRTCRGVAEVEAESVAYLVCETAGLATGCYTFPYVAGWSSGDLAVIQQTAQRAITTARGIIGATREEASQCESLATCA